MEEVGDLEFHPSTRTSARFYALDPNGSLIDSGRVALVSRFIVSIE